MGAVTKRILSGSVAGLPIGVCTTVSVVIHQGQSTTTIIDEVYAWATNCATTAISLNILHGSESQVWQVDVPPKGNDPLLILPGLLAAGHSLTQAYSFQASTSDSIVVTGYVNRLDQG